jgi:hypothetical protein
MPARLERGHVGSDEWGHPSSQAWPLGAPLQPLSPAQMPVVGDGAGGPGPDSARNLRPSAPWNETRRQMNPGASSPPGCPRCFRASEGEEDRSGAVGGSALPALGSVWWGGLGCLVGSTERVSQEPLFPLGRLQAFFLPPSSPPSSDTFHEHLHHFRAGETEARG